MSPHDTPNPIAAKFDEAVGLHTQGQIGQAIPIYDAILREDPRHSDALHLLGLAKHQLGHAAEGAELIERAIEMNPGDAAYRSNLSSVYKALGRVADAIVTLEAAIEIDPKFLPAHYNVAELYTLQGDLERGEASYRRSVELNPGLPEIWTNLGLCLAKRGALEEAEEALYKALDLMPEYNTALYALGHVREKQERPGEAAQLFEQAMKFGFDEPACLRRLAGIASAESDSEAAVRWLERLDRSGNGDASVCNNLGLAYQNLDRRDQAWEAFHKALALDPDHVETLCNVANLLNEEGDFDQSIERCLRCIEIDPSCDIAFNNLGTAYKATARPERAIEAYEKAIALKPQRAEYRNNVGLVYQYVGRIEDMETSFREAIRLDPDYATALANYACALLNFGHLTKAKGLLDQALIVDPNLVSGWNNLARYHFEVGDFKESAKAYRRFLSIDPGNVLGLGSLAATQIVRDDVEDREVFAAHEECGCRLEAATETLALDASDLTRPGGGPLRVGFVSADLRAHSVAFFLEPLLANLDRARFEIHCYSGVFNKDKVTRRLEALAAHWRDVAGMPDDALARQIREDRIEILVDLSGYTSGNRATVFAMRPAPAQVNWLGYPHSTGLTRMDYRIVDAVTDPEGVTFNSERLARLPDCFLCFRPSHEAPETGPLPLSANGFPTFGSFNNLSKLTPRSIDLFARVLRGSPGSRLIMKSHQSADTAIRDRVFGRFADRGIDRSRIELLPRYPSMTDHLNAYNRVDVALDTYPYTGTTTTCEALWMGVPVVTLAGTRHASRVSASILTAVGRPDLIASSDDEYERIALQLVRDAGSLGAARAGLRARLEASPLRDEPGFARKFEAALDSIWRERAASASGAR